MKLHSLRAPLCSAALAAAAFLFPGCNETSVASSEVGNPPAKGIVTGALLDDDETPAAGAVVRLFPVACDPVRDSAATRWRDTADASGAFAFDGVDTGLYNVEAADPAHGTALLLRGIRVLKDRMVTARAGILKPTGAVSLVLPDLPATADAYVYIAGTSVFARLPPGAKENPKLLLQGVPSGATPEILYRPSPAAEDTLVASEVPVAPADTVPASVHPGWAHSLRIRLDLSATGAGVDGDHEHFPVAVRLGLGGQPFDFSQAAGNGADIRFTDKAGLPHKFEIETWDSAGGRAVVWVCAGTVKGNTSDQFMRMYWGRPGASSLSQPAFTADLGYVGIWHMRGLEGGKIADGTQGDNDLLPSADPAFAEGPLGRHVRLDGQPRLLATGKALASPQAFSITLWFNTTSDSGGKLVGFGASPTLTDTSRDRHVWMDDTGRVHFGVLPNQGPGPFRRAILSAPGRWNDGKWHHLAAVLSPSAGMSLFLDGRKVAEDTATRSAQVYASPTGYWRVGYDFPLYDWLPKPSAQYFQGALDEVRVCHKPFNAARIRLEYESQREGSRFLRFESM